MDLQSYSNTLTNICPKIITSKKGRTRDAGLFLQSQSPHTSTAPAEIQVTECWSRISTCRIARPSPATTERGPACRRRNRRNRPLRCRFGLSTSVPHDNPRNHQVRNGTVVARFVGTHDCCLTLRFRSAPKGARFALHAGRQMSSFKREISSDFSGFLR